MCSLPSPFLSLSAHTDNHSLDDAPLRPLRAPIALPAPDPAAASSNLSIRSHPFTGWTSLVTLSKSRSFRVPTLRRSCRVRHRR